MGLPDGYEQLLVRLVGLLGYKVPLFRFMREEGAAYLEW